MHELAEDKAEMKKGKKQKKHVHTFSAYGGTWIRYVRAR